MAAPVVLVADDEEDVRRLVRARLAGQGYEVVLASDGRQALQLIRDRRPAVAILDNRMPHLDGLEVCRRIKAEEALRPVRVMIITASEIGLAPEALRAAQADDYLPKPFDGAELLARVRRLIASNTTADTQGGPP